MINFIERKVGVKPFVDDIDKVNDSHNEVLIIDDQIYNLIALQGLVKKQGLDSDKCLSG